MRLATNGASKKVRISIPPISRRLFRFVERFLQLGDIVIEQFEIIGDFLFPANRRHEHDNFTTRVARYRVGGLQVKVRLHGDDLGAVAFHQAYQLNGMLGTRRDAGARLNVANYVEMEMLGEIGPGTVVGHNFATGVGLHLGQPLFVGLLDALFEVVIPLCKIRGIVGAHLGQFVLYALGNAETVFRVEPVVRVAERMDVALSPRDYPRWNLQNLGVPRSVEVARRTDLDFWVGGLCDQGRQPADFQFEADHDEEVRFAKFEQKTGLGFDEMWVLVAASNRFDFNSVTANFLREGGQIRCSRHDVQFARGARGGRTSCAEQGERCN